MSCLKTYVSILYCCNCWYNYECIFVIAPWGTLIGIKILYCIVLYCIVLYCLIFFKSNAVSFRSFVDNYDVSSTQESRSIYILWVRQFCIFRHKNVLKICLTTQKSSQVTDNLLRAHLIECFCITWRPFH